MSAVSERIQRMHAQLRIMRPRHAARTKQRMNVPRQRFSFRKWQIHIIERKIRNVQARFGESLRQRLADCALAAALTAAHANDERVSRAGE